MAIRADSENPLPRWACLLAHENDYLSWTRNAIITTVAAAAFYNVEPTASVGLFGIGTLFLGVGTAKYWTYTYHLRKVLNFSTSYTLTAIVMPAALIAMYALAVVSLVDDSLPEPMHENLRGISSYVWHRSEVRQRRAVRRQQLQQLFEQRESLTLELEEASERATGVAAWLGFGAQVQRVAKLEDELERTEAAIKTLSGLKDSDGLGDAASKAPPLALCITDLKAQQRR